ncbi:OmpH family outer membrane protein [Croceiramulus getboli]|nr:OmpH family outer membrane protein [Flavobacteriaceae bacterium YJPT1-3]
MKKVVLAIAFAVMSMSVIAQTKIGTIDSDLIIGSHPDLKKVQTDLTAYTKTLDDQMKEMLQKYQTQVQDYQAKESTMLAADKKMKQDEIIKLEQEIQQFRQNSSQLIQIKQNELMQPIYEKVGRVLDEVAKAEGYTQVLTLNNTVAFFDTRFDLTETVAKKLGITLPQ